MSPSEPAEPRHSYATLLGRQDGTVDILLVNRERQKFVIRPEPFLALLQSPRTPIKVKRRDKRPSQAVHHHGGDIWGVYDEGAPLATFVFYFGELSRDMIWADGDDEPSNFLTAQEFRLSMIGIKSMQRVFTLLANQKEECQLYVSEADFRPDMMLAIAKDARRSKKS